jgi:hypothetical protein
MVCGALPAILTFFIRLCVPESSRWEHERARGATSSWAGRDLLAVLAGVAVCAGLLGVWYLVDQTALRVLATVAALILAAGCYLYPIYCYLTRSGEAPAFRRTVLRNMLVAAAISGVPLLATWGSVQWAPLWAHQLGQKAAEKSPDLKEAVRFWKEYTQITSAFGAMIGSLFGSLLAAWAGRRVAYVFLCLASLGAVLWFYQGNSSFDAMFLLGIFLGGGFSAAFYGWLPLYLPELFPTRVRATGQGFGFNFGRILAAVGVLQVPALMGNPPDYSRACSYLALIYVAGVVVIWLAPETRGRPLPE